MSDFYYVCRACGHYWSEPESPARCESCSALASGSIDRYAGSFSAEQASERVYAALTAYAALRTQA